MKVNEIVAGCEYGIQTIRAYYTVRETRKGELILEARDREMKHESLNKRTLIINQERE